MKFFKNVVSLKYLLFLIPAFLIITLIIIIVNVPYNHDGGGPDCVKREYNINTTSEWINVKTRLGPTLKYPPGWTLEGCVQGQGEIKIYPNGNKDLNKSFQLGTLTWGDDQTARENCDTNHSLNNPYIEFTIAKNLERYGGNLPDRIPTEDPNKLSDSYTSQNYNRFYSRFIKNGTCYQIFYSYPFNEPLSGSMMESIYKSVQYE